MLNIVQIVKVTCYVPNYRTMAIYLKEAPQQSLTMTIFVAVKCDDLAETTTLFM